MSSSPTHKGPLLIVFPNFLRSPKIGSKFQSMKFTIFFIAIFVSGELENRGYNFLATVVLVTALFELGKDFLENLIVPDVRKARAKWLPLLIGESKYLERFNEVGKPKKFDRKPMYSREAGFIYLYLCLFLMFLPNSDEWARKTGQDTLDLIRNIVEMSGQNTNISINESQVGSLFALAIDWAPLLLLVVAGFFFLQRFIHGDEPW